MAFREVIEKFIVAAGAFNQKLNVDGYLSSVSDDCAENFRVFSRFANECSDTLLCHLALQGYCRGHSRLLNLIAQQIFVHESFGHSERDVTGIISGFLQRYEQAGKHRELKLNKNC